jgi:hypothetical protein
MDTQRREDIHRAWLATQVLQATGLRELRLRWDLAHRMDAPRPALRGRACELQGPQRWGR